MESLFPGGTDVPYTLTDGVLSVEVAGDTHTGSWDGAKLVIDGVEAAKQS